jgi:hypothetical protein
MGQEEIRTYVAELVASGIGPSSLKVEMAGIKFPACVPASDDLAGCAARARWNRCATLPPLRRRDRRSTTA